MKIMLSELRKIIREESLCLREGIDHGRKNAERDAALQVIRGYFPAAQPAGQFSVRIDQYQLRFTGGAIRVFAGMSELFVVHDTSTSGADVVCRLLRGFR